LGRASGQGTVVVRASRSFVPDVADIVWVDFTPQVGHEQAGRRPAVVLSPREYNQKVGLAILCPITSRVKGYPFELELPPGLAVHGSIQVDQLKSVDWRQRRVQRLGRLPASILHEVRQTIATLLGIS
jgi:mRNA interferase MazF